MTQLDDLAFSLMAAGGAPDSEKRGTQLLYVDPKTSHLISKLWTGAGNELEQAEVIAESVRLDSKASYVIGQSIRLIAYISSGDELRISELDDDTEEWFDDQTILQYKVHPHGHVAAFLLPNNQIRIIFQDSSKRFNLLDKINGSWSQPTIIPVEPTAGSPIGSWTYGNQLHIFYVSAKDNCLHYIVEENGSWKDVAVEACVLDTLKPKRLAVLPGLTAEKLFQVFVMSEANTLWKFTAETQKLEKLGKMNGDKFQPDSSEEWFNVIYNLGPTFNYSPRFNFGPWFF